MGRPVGSREIELWQIREIVEGSVMGLNRSEIAARAEVSGRTVYSYQFSLGLV